MECCVATSVGGDAVSQCNQLILLSVLRTEVSRHFKVIRVLGFWDVPTRMSQCWVTKKE
jgi:hypothetical protein